MEIPDPYYGGANGFDDVYAMVEEASQGLLRHILQTDLQEN
jgi:protein-tyrosine phosphatase